MSIDSSDKLLKSSRPPLGRTLAVAVAVVAVLSALSAISHPVLSRKQSPAAILVSFLLLLTHGALYWMGSDIRARWGVVPYALAQGAVLFGVVLSAAPGPVGIVLFMVATAELVILAGARWGTVPIAVGAIALYVIAELLTSGLYRATTVGILLTLTAAIAHVAVAFARQRQARESTGAIVATGTAVAADNATIPERPPSGTLSARETEVLRELVRGARSSDIGMTLGISERTVKAHLASIYQKLGVTSRAAAVASAMRRGLV